MLSKCRFPTPDLDTRVILSHVINADELALLTHPDRELSTEALEKFHSLMHRRQKGEPVAYLTQCKEFWGRNFHVHRGVFVPRPDTETLVEGLIPRLSSGARIHDECSGTGCIAITLACEIPHAQVSASDVSPKAVQTIRINNVRHGHPLQGIFQSYCLSSLSEPVDCITANPPYLRVEETHCRAAYEPLRALQGGTDGLQCIRQLVCRAADLLRPEGILAMEIGHTQEEQTRDIFATHHFTQLETLHDLQGHPRVITGIRHAN